MMVDCECVCGNLKTLTVNRLGVSTRSCGCLHRDTAAATGKASASHGMVRTRTYARWASMLGRTTNPNSKNYLAYKGRVPSARWFLFENFFEDMGVCPEGYSLERVDNELPYSKANCMWIPKNQQPRNRPATVWVLQAGNSERMTLKEASEAAGISYETVRMRRYRKWSISKTLGESFSLA